MPKVTFSAPQPYSGQNFRVFFLGVDQSINQSITGRFNVA